MCILLDSLKMGSRKCRDTIEGCSLFHFVFFLIFFTSFWHIYRFDRDKVVGTLTLENLIHSEKKTGALLFTSDGGIKGT